MRAASSSCGSTVSNAALAARFVDYLSSPPAQAVLAKHGFGKP